MKKGCDFSFQLELFPDNYHLHGDQILNLPEFWILCSKILSTRELEAVVLRYMGHCTTTEMGCHMDVNRVTAWIYLARARAKLRKREKELVRMVLKPKLRRLQ